MDTVTPPRKQHRCRACGSPMKGHSKAKCSGYSPTPSRGSSVAPDADQNSAKKRGVVMPGAYDDTRPSVVSNSSARPNPSPLINRLGPKIEEEDDSVSNINGEAQVPYDHNTHARRRASEPLQPRQTMLSRVETIYPEQSASQRLPMDVGVAGPSSYYRGDQNVINSDRALEEVLWAQERYLTAQDAYDGIGRGFPSSFSNARRVVSEMVVPHHEYDTASSVASSASTNSTTLKEMIVSAGGQLLANVVQVESRFVDPLRLKAAKKNIFAEIVRGVGADAPGARNSPETPFYWVVLGRNGDAVRMFARSYPQMSINNATTEGAMVAAQTAASQVAPQTTTSRGVVSKISSLMRYCLVFLFGGVFMLLFAV